MSEAQDDFFKKILDAAHRNMRIMNGAESDTLVLSDPALSGHIPTLRTREAAAIRQSSASRHSTELDEERRKSHERLFTKDWFRRPHYASADPTLFAFIRAGGSLTRDSFRNSVYIPIDRAIDSVGRGHNPSVESSASSGAAFTQTGADLILSRCIELYSLEDELSTGVWLDDDLLKATFYWMMHRYRARSILGIDDVYDLLADCINSLAVTGYTTQHLSNYIKSREGDRTTKKIDNFADGMAWSFSYDLEDKPHVIIFPSPPDDWTPMDCKALTLSERGRALVIQMGIDQSVDGDSLSPLPEEDGSNATLLEHMGNT